MAIKGLIDLLFSSSHLISATLLVDIVGQYRSSTAPIEKALEEIATVDAASAAGRTVAIVDALVQRLVDATEQVDFVSYPDLEPCHLTSQLTSRTRSAISAPSPCYALARRI